MANGSLHSSTAGNVGQALAKLKSGFISGKNTELFFTPAINKTYHIHLYLIHDADATGRIKMNMDIPTGATILGNNSTFVNTPAADTDYDADRSLVTGGEIETSSFWMVLVMSTTAGNCTLTWAQNSSNNSSIIKKGSMLIAYEE